SRAQEKLEAALEQKPDSKLLHFNLGSVDFRLGDFQSALTQFQGALGDEDDRFASKVYYNIACCQMRLNHPQQALDAFKKAVRLDPADRDARINLEFVANLLAQAEPSQRAKDAYTEALQLIEKRLYRQALETMNPILKNEPAAVRRYSNFVRR